MSSQDHSDVGEDGVLCCFPTLPYELRYQIAFDLIVPLCAHVDPSAAGDCQRLVRVELIFPDGIVCNPAMVQNPPLPGVAPQFFAAPQPGFSPPVVPGIPHVTPQFAPQPSMGLVDPMPCQDHLHSRMIVFVRNGQLGECLEVNDTPYKIIRRCDMCDEFHSVQESIHIQPSQGFPEGMPSHEQPGYSRQQPSTSGMTGQSGTSNASPRKASHHVAPDSTQEDTTNASPSTANGRVATNRKNPQPKEEITCYIKTIEGDIKQLIIEGLNGEEVKNFTFLILGSQSTDELLAHALGIWESCGQNNDDNVPKDKNKTKDATNVGNDK